ncbi:unnamed protein product (macronuclear) [Paramecium tetraurelia]|uniref:Uncharacterized protein n=1 Tax=Paramecium tetraurelia TaxID=5888 RepID=A0CI17_PARTE|nr:uncharacterized protein GSPATT00038538001 [Paramecium tetraurelia]CAK70434.1 unnamed protein product [Paramecium tetraurelia]|eukprot:XP_001437831.1 hypothetical protein (macronuclear) [Paramecium tetraurelia strain d4-2]
MKQKNNILSTSLLLIIIELVTNQICQKTDTTIKSIIRGNYLMSNFQNHKIYIEGGNEGSCLLDNIYIVEYRFGHPTSLIGTSIIFYLYQTYELNTLKIWFWDLKTTFYAISDFIIFNNIETIIYESSRGQLITFQIRNQQRFSKKSTNRIRNNLSFPVGVKSTEFYISKRAYICIYEGISFLNNYLNLEETNFACFQHFG